MPTLLETLATELERPRHVSAQVIKHIVGTHDVAREDIGAFLVTELPKLEDYEIDLILAPLFTPTLADQAVFAEFLGRDSVATDQWPALIKQLIARPTHTQLVTEDRTTHQIPLRDVTVERFVHRLRLDGAIAEPILALITNHPRSTARPILKAVARRAIWENQSRAEILSRFLETASGSDTQFSDDAVALMKLVETYEPASVSDLLRRIPSWQQTLRQEINEAGAKPFFNERVEELHGGGRDQRRQDNSRTTAKENEFAFLERLQRALA